MSVAKNNKKMDLAKNKNVFISWSGKRSNKVALALREWLPKVNTAIKPWMSSDIPAGVQWYDKLAERLNSTKMGIICLTKYNYDVPYLLFESGALAKTFDNEVFVCPYLIDHTPKEFQSLPSPLIHFQAKSANKKGTLELIKALNNSLDDPLDNNLLKKIFERWWPDLEKILDEVHTMPEHPNPQINGLIKVKYHIRKYKHEDIEIRKLIKSDEDRLKLTWDTLIYGIEDLTKKIKDCPGGGSFDIIVGINETGIIIASYLSANFGKAPIGTIRTGRLCKAGERIILQCDLPNTDKKVDRPMSVAIVDLETETGNSAKLVIDKIKEKYKNKIETMFIVLCGVIKKGDEEREIDDINYFGWDVAEEYKPDLIAFCVDFSGVRGPGGMR